MHVDIAMLMALKSKTLEERHGRVLSLTQELDSTKGAEHVSMSYSSCR
jgi:hypothetical protein